MANDHYIPRFLTKPWQFGRAELRYFDFCTRNFDDAPARKLFAKQDLNSPALETWLNRKVETPVGAFANKLRQGEAADAPKDWTTQRALALLFILNPQRIAEAVWPERDDISLEVLATWPDAKLDAMAKWVFDSFKLSIVAVPRELFFTESVTFAYPMPERPVLALPLGLGHALLAYDGPLSAPELLRSVSAATLSAFSLGVGANVQRVILSPGWRDASTRDPDTTRQELCELREGLAEMFNLVGKYSERVGLTGWQVT